MAVQTVARLKSQVIIPLSFRRMFRLLLTRTIRSKQTHTIKPIIHLLHRLNLPIPKSTTNRQDNPS